MKDLRLHLRFRSEGATAISTVLKGILVVSFCIWNKIQNLPSHSKTKQCDACENSSTFLKYIPAEPIDLVYTWVNGSDEMFLESMSKYVKLSEINRNRYSDHNELLFSLRSIEKFAPWIRHIYIVTNGQIPNWLNLDNTRVSIVTHVEICPPELIERALPTFSSSAIEMMLHRIPGLSERFLYMNDDFYLGKPLLLDDLRTDQHGIYTVPAWPFLYCSATCKWKNIGDNVCNEECYDIACNFDGGDCQSIIASGHLIEKTVEATSAFADVKHNSHSKSLTHTHGVLSKRYGFKNRTSIAHMGILIEKEVMRTVVNVFKREVHNTISHRFRHGEDSLQFQLAYSETLLSEVRQRTVEEIFSLFDMDESGTLTNDEVVQFLKYYNLSTLNRTHIEHIRTNVAMECNPNDISSCNGFLNSDIPSCDDTFLNCTTFIYQFHQKFGYVKKFKATVHPAAETLNEYAIITENVDMAKRTFNRLLTVRKAFHCINDVIEPTSTNYFDSDEYKEITELWLHFYLKLFPDPSQFELPNGMRNSCRYIDECHRATDKL